LDGLSKVGKLVGVPPVMDRHIANKAILNFARILTGVDIS